MPDVNGELNIKVYKMTGELFFQQSVKGNTFQIELPKKTNGLYMIKVYSDIYGELRKIFIVQ